MLKQRPPLLPGKQRPSQQGPRVILMLQLQEVALVKLECLVEGIGQHQDMVVVMAESQDGS